jgi:hypothetical protein
MVQLIHKDNINRIGTVIVSVNIEDMKTIGLKEYYRISENILKNKSKLDKYIKIKEEDIKIVIQNIELGNFIKMNFEEKPKSKE